MINFLEVRCDFASVDRVIALLISPIRVPLVRDNGKRRREKTLAISRCKVTMVSKNGRRLFSGVPIVNCKAEFRLLAVESTDSLLN